MPQLMVRGISAEEICSISKPMIDDLEKILECPRSYFTVEVLKTTFILDGEIVRNYPFIEISWFDRGQEIQDQVASVVTGYVHELGYKDVDLYFNVLQNSRYYENGTHF